MRTLVWFRNDLRVADNPALFDAMDNGEAVAVFCICNRQWRDHDVGDNRFAFLLDSLHALGDDLRGLGVPLRVITEPRFDDVPRRLTGTARQLEADAVAFNAEYPLNERRRDAAVRRALEAAGVAVRIHHGGVILPPGSVLTQDGAPYAVFTPFKRRWLQRLDASARESLPAPRRQNRPDIDDSPLAAQMDGVGRDRVQRLWPAGAREARRRLNLFVSQRIGDYNENRNLPRLDGTSTLSPYLSVGSISARQCLAAALAANDGRASNGRAGVSTWIGELAWRDFFRHVTTYTPRINRGRAFRPEMDALPWRHAPDELEAWKQGRTGYPLVDAGMRQLAATGWMHNRLRMLTAMFLSKHLLLDWRLGESHFMQLLVDGDFAANNGGWQWSASTGTDAAPYFRIFNPHTQARRFDPDGTFIRRFVPELADVPTAVLFDPGSHDIPGYARPIVDHAFARQRALDTFKAVQAGDRPR